MSMREAIIAACKIMGSQATLARHLGVTRQAVSKWIKTGRTPSRRVLTIEQATKGLLTRYDLRPDVYPRYEPPQPERVYSSAEDTPCSPRNGRSQRTTYVS